MSALVVVLASRGACEGVLDVLQDLSALDALEPFLWVTAECVTESSVPAVEVRGGTRRSTTLQHELVTARYDRIRICVLVPLVDGGTVVTSSTEQQVAGLAESIVRVPMHRLRCVLVRPPTRDQDSEQMVREGWHNVVIAPEDSAGPRRASSVLPPPTDAVDVGRHAAPVVASVLGLWSGVDWAPLDHEAALPGRAVREVRSFYRRLDAAAVEQDLRSRVSDVRATTPLPRDHGRIGVHIEEVHGATTAMANALWTKHRAVLQGARVAEPSEHVQRIGAMAALRMFFGFLGAVLRNTPAQWYAAVVNGAASRLAAGVHSAVFGSAPSAYEVMVKGRTASGVPASWEESAAAARSLDDALGVSEPFEHPAPPPLGALWQDYAAAAMTLVDGGERDGALPPVQVGHSTGVLRDVADCVPSWKDAFTSLSGYMAATVGASELQPVDVLGLQDLGRRLEHLSGEPVSALEADRALAELRQWHGSRVRSFGFQVGSVLGGRINQVSAEIQRLLADIEQLAAAQEPDAAVKRHQRRLATWLRIVLGVAVLLGVAAVVVAVAEIVDVWTALGLLAAIVVTWFVTTFLLFINQQRELFRELHRRRVASGRLDATRQNLRYALRDQRRLASAYRQFLAWSTILGEFLSQPFGRRAADGAATPHVVEGLPSSTGMGVAQVEPAVIAESAVLLRRSLYLPGWLSDPFDALLTDVSQSLGAEAYDLREHPDLIFSMPAGSGESLLDRWCTLVRERGIPRAGGERLWTQALARLDSSGTELRDGLVTSVHVSGARSAVPPGEFMAGVDASERFSARDRFSDVLLSTRARAAESNVVETTTGRTVRRGLGRVAVVVQLGPGLSDHDFWPGDRPEPGGYDDDRPDPVPGPGGVDDIVI